MKNMETSDLLDTMECAVNALKMLTHLCADTEDKQLAGMYWLLAPIIEKQEQTMADLWKAEAKK
jgi:hypothetical protein